MANQARTNDTPVDPKLDAAGVSRLEWIVAVIGLLLVAGSIAYLVYIGLTKSGTPPDVVASVERILPGVQGHRVELTVRNSGGRTAEEVVIEGRLMEGEQTLETGEVTLDFLPPDSERKATMTFRDDPRRHRLVLHTRGYREP